MRRSTSRLSQCLGFSVAEVTIILTSLSILSAAAAPAVDDYVNRAKLVKAHHDVSTLSVTLIRLFSDTTAEANIPNGWATYDLLVGGGAIPRPASREATAWTTRSGKTVGLLDDQLIYNRPGYSRPPADTFSTFGWRGAYLQERVAADPWGNRYALNAGSMKSAGMDAVVITAGPNGIVESLFSVDGLPTRGDDIAASVSSGARP
jgi:hypothetical protein